MLIFICSLVFEFFVDQSPTQFTIGKIERIYRPLRQSKRAVYTYQIDGAKYSYSLPIEGNAEVGDCYIVKVPVEYLGKGKILFAFPAHGDCSMGEVWERIPDDFQEVKTK